MPSELVWSDEAVSILKRLWAEKSARELSKIFWEDLGLSISRNAIIGKANRLGMTKRMKGKGSLKPKPYAAKKPIEPKFTIAYDSTKGLTLNDLNHRTCRYPISQNQVGNKTEYFFCGKEAKKTYCPEHYKICVKKTELASGVAKAILAQSA